MIIFRCKVPFSEPRGRFLTFMFTTVGTDPIFKGLLQGFVSAHQHRHIRLHAAYVRI